MTARIVPSVEWNAGEGDVYDDMTWTSDAVSDLVLVMRNGGTVEDAAAFLCRSGNVEEVRRKAQALGWFADYAWLSGAVTQPYIRQANNNAHHMPNAAKTCFITSPKSLEYV